MYLFNDEYLTKSSRVLSNFGLKSSHVVSMMFHSYFAFRVYVCVKSSHVMYFGCFVSHHCVHFLLTWHSIMNVQKWKFWVVDAHCSDVSFFEQTNLVLPWWLILINRSHFLWKLHLFRGTLKLFKVRRSTEYHTHYSGRSVCTEQIICFVWTFELSSCNIWIVVGRNRR